MSAELGQASLWAALLAASILGLLPLIGSYTGNRRLMAVGSGAALIQCLLLAISFGILTSAFVVQDFSLEYVARNSNSLLPMRYRYSAVWSAHEGSLLLWELILTLWIATVALFSKKRLPEAFRARVLAVLGWISAGFLLFVLLGSSPFKRIVPAVVDGSVLNPALQDLGLIIHPPLLYMGYVGFSVAFAFAISALLGGEVARDWVRWSRPWTLVAWAFLTLGIAVGSWWTYYELGWGGWWFWDPVENAPFMPWLVGTALIHSQPVTEKRGAFRTWTLLLAISAFVLSLLGTFLMRSDALSSVHTFTSNPASGTLILVYLALIVGGPLILYTTRVPGMVRGVGFAGISRETFLMLNNHVIAAMVAVVLLGTLYPLLIHMLGAGSISVAPSYFGLLLTWLLVPIVLALPIGIYARWEQDIGNRLSGQLRWPFLVSLVSGSHTWAMHPGIGWVSAAGVTGGAWVILGSMAYVAQFLRKKGTFKIPSSMLAMTLAHIGLGVFLVGLSLTNTLSSREYLLMEAGDRLEMAGYTIRFMGTRAVQGPNYLADEAEFIISKDGRLLSHLYPQKRRYTQGGRIMTKVAIDAGFWRDLYISMGELRGQTWAMRIYYKPFIRWIWLGALLTVAGGFLAATNKRYRRKIKGHKAEQVVYRQY